MTHPASGRESSLGGGAGDRGDEVMRQTGVLDEAVNALKESRDSDQVEPEEVGRWITVIGKAVMAIFKL